MLSLLDQFDVENPEWSFEDLHDKVGFSRSTLYRYLKTLCDAGLLDSFPGRGYVLGPRIIQLNYQIKTTDPLIRIARPVMQELTSEYSCVSLLCRRYQQKVLCVHQESSTSRFQSNYERGNARPLLQGAASLAILAHFSIYRLSKLFEVRPSDFSEAGLGSTLPEVREVLKSIRKTGWVSSCGQVTEGVTGVAAPIFDGNDEVTGSLSLTLPEKDIPDSEVEQIGTRIKFCARVLSKSLK